MAHDHFGGLESPRSSAASQCQWLPIFPRSGVGGTGCPTSTNAAGPTEDMAYAAGRGGLRFGVAALRCTTGRGTATSLNCPRDRQRRRDSSSADLSASLGPPR